MNKHNELKEYRCKKCGRLLGKFKGCAEIVCPKCKTVNSIIKNEISIK